MNEQFSGSSTQLKGMPRSRQRPATWALSARSSVAAMTMPRPATSPSSKGLKRSFTPLSEINCGENCPATAVTSAPYSSSFSHLRSATFPPPITRTF